MNSTLGSVVPLAMFSYHGAYLKTIEDNNSKLEDILDSVHLGYYWYSDQN